MIPEFDVPSPFEAGTAIDGAALLPETASDHTALHTIVEAWEKLTYESKSSLPGLSWLTPKQLAFVLIAYPWCSVLSSSEFESSFLMADSHPLNFMRINRGFGHVSEYMKTFNCTSKHGLFRKNPCRILD